MIGRHAQPVKAGRDPRPRWLQPLAAPERVYRTSGAGTPQHGSPKISIDFNPGLEAATDSPQRDALCFAFSGDRLLCGQEAPGAPQRGDALARCGLPVLLRCYLGTLNNRPCWACALPDDADPPPGMTFDSLYRLLEDEPLFALAGRALQLLTWGRQHRFCGQCGQETLAVPGERALRCAACELLVYPRLSPCVIVLINRGDEMLLARNKRFPTALFSALAGFVEPGETVEQTVHREVGEEVGVAVDKLRYFGSQPWPFPHQLMLGFYAEHRDGDIVVDGEEIAEARWCHYRDLPQVPPRHSLSGRMIDRRVRQLSGLPR